MLLLVVCPAQKKNIVQVSSTICNDYNFLMMITFLFHSVIYFFVFVSKSSVNFTLTCINASSLKIARVAGVLGIFGKKIFLYHFCQIIPKRISCSVWSKNKGGAGGGLSPWSVTACYEASFHNPVYLVIFREWPFCSKDKEILQAIASERQRKAYKGLIQI